MSTISSGILSSSYHKLTEETVARRTYFFYQASAFLSDMLFILSVSYLGIFQDRKSR